MARRIELSEHLSSDELRGRFRTASDPVAKTHWQLLWLYAQGQSTAEVARTTGYSCEWVRTLVRRYNEQGPEAMQDGRSHNPGAAPLLSPSQQEELVEALRGPAPRGGMWSGPEVAQWITAKLGRPVAAQRGWEYLRKAGYTPQVPRPRHGKADREAQARFQGGTAGPGRSGAGAPPGSGA